MKNLLTGLVFISSSIVFSQNDNSMIDSLLSELDGAKNKLDTLEIAFALCDNHEKYEERVIYAKFAIEISKTMRSGKYLALAYQNMAELNSENHLIDDAISWKSMETEIWKKYNYKIELADSYYELAELNEKMGSSSEAQIAFEKALELYEKDSIYNGIVKVKNSLGKLHKNLNDLANSLEFYFEVLDLERKKEMDSQEANTLLNIGEIYKLQGEFDLAQDFYQKAIEKFRYTDSPLGIGKTTNNLGNIYRQQGDLNQALAYYNSALILFTEAGSETSIANVYNDIGLVKESQNKLRVALSSYKKALDLKLKCNLIYSVPSTYGNIASVNGKLGNDQYAEDYFQKGIEMAKKYEIQEELAYLYKKKAEYEEENGDMVAALALFKQCLAYEDSAMKKENSRRIAELQTIYALGEIEEKNEVLELKNQLLTKDKLDERNRKVQLQVIIYGLLIIVILVAVLLANNYRKLQYIKNITTRLKETNQELTETLISKDEKELLLKEIHHRVKNNLQVISSLIRLQASKIENPKVEGLFQECEVRVKSMALVHEELYRTDDLSSVNLTEYIRKLGNDLLQAYVIDKKIGFKHDVGVSFMGIDTLIPLGLMINEIISNSLKHGFKGNETKDPEIYINIQFTDLKEYEMTIGDNGAGMSEDIDFEFPESLGLDLILTLAEQLEGTVERLSELAGTHYLVKFKDLDIRGIIHE
jgi:two-component system, sensor histidine kinase PdtaS